MSEISTTPAMTVPNFIQPIDITKMSDDELELMLEGIRTRRMQVVHIHQETMKVRDKADQFKMLRTFDAKTTALKKHLDSYDRLIEKIEKTLQDIRVLRLQMGDYTP